MREARAWNGKGFRLDLPFSRVMLPWIPSIDDTVPWTTVVWSLRAHVTSNPTKDAALILFGGHQGGGWQRRASRKQGRVRLNFEEGPDYYLEFISNVEGSCLWISCCLENSRCRDLREWHSRQCHWQWH